MELNEQAFEFEREEDEISTLFELNDEVLCDWKENSIKPHVTYFLIALTDMFEAVAWYDVCEYLGYGVRFDNVSDVIQMLDLDGVVYEIMHEN